MSAAKLVLDEELARLADLRGSASAEAYVTLGESSASANSRSAILMVATRLGRSNN